VVRREERYTKQRQALPQSRVQAASRWVPDQPFYGWVIRGRNHRGRFSVLLVSLQHAKANLEKPVKTGCQLNSLLYPAVKRLGGNPAGKPRERGSGYAA
jgi:hypothetical protein